jgi:hypothetical protein
MLVWIFFVLLVYSAVAEHATCDGRGQNRCWGTIQSTEAACSARQIGCVHTIPLEWDPFPLTAEMLARSIPYDADLSRLNASLRKAEMGGDFNVVVLGGSVTIGRGCTIFGKRVMFSNNAACSWVRRFEDWAQQRFPQAAVNVHNRARTSCDSSCQIALLSELLPSDENINLIIVDLSSNDGWAVEHERSLGTTPREPAPLTSDEVDQLSMLHAAVEVMVRYTTNLRSSPAVIYLEGIRDVTWYKPAWSVQDWVRPIVEPYGAHMVSYRDAVWPVFEQHNDTVSSVFWESRDKIHPSWRYVNPSHTHCKHTVAECFVNN